MSEPHDIESANPSTPGPTADRDYAERLAALSGARWKRVLHVQAPYQAHIRRLNLGRTIDIGCGFGRNLLSLAPGSVGVDHNSHSVSLARSMGLEAHTVEEFFAKPDLSKPEGFDSLLASHLIEHLSPREAREILADYVKLLRPNGKVALITPQERGYASDATHRTFSGYAELRELCVALGLSITNTYSFPFPRWAGRLFVYNEFVALARKNPAD